MNTNFDEVRIDLTQPQNHNILDETMRMEDAERDDSVKEVRFVRIEAPDGVWGYELRDTDNPREDAFSLSRNGRYQAKVIMNRQTGAVSLSTDSNKNALRGVVLMVRVIRANWNRIPR